MKKLIYFVFLCFTFILFSCSESADKIVTITGDDVRFRTAPTTASNVITSFVMNTEMALISDNAGTGNGCSLWYKVKYNNQEGYVCSEFAIVSERSEEVINPSDYTEYSDYLKELGFPDSYLPALIKLHNSHPDWQFKVFKVNLDFTTVTNQEYNGYSRGWSLIEDTGRYYDGYKSTESWSYNYLTDIFANNFTGGGINRP